MPRGWHTTRVENEKEVYLDFDKALTEDGRKAEAGLHFSSDNSLYINVCIDRKARKTKTFFYQAVHFFLIRKVVNSKLKIARKLPAPNFPEKSLLIMRINRRFVLRVA